MDRLTFGWTAPPISEQLQKAGIRYDEKAIEHHQKDADAIMRLSTRGLLTDAQEQSAIKKLAKAISAAVPGREKVKPGGRKCSPSP